jgi:hypothetical protein
LNGMLRVSLQRWVLWVNSVRREIVSRSYIDDHDAPTFKIAHTHPILLELEHLVLNFSSLSYCPLAFYNNRSDARDTLFKVGSRGRTLNVHRRLLRIVGLYSSGGRIHRCSFAKTRIGSKKSKVVYQIKYIISIYINIYIYRSYPLNRYQTWLTQRFFAVTRGRQSD